jgi:alpha-glucosidase
LHGDLGFGNLSHNTLAISALHSGGYTELDVHNLWGLMEAKATHLAVKDLLPGTRPFLISRSTFPSAGKWTGHWVSESRVCVISARADEFVQLGDNFSKWKYMYFSIQGVLQFNLFQIPFVGADVCGFSMFLGVL